MKIKWEPERELHFTMKLNGEILTEKEKKKVGGEPAVGENRAQLIPPLDQFDCRIRFHYIQSPISLLLCNSL